MASKQIKWAIPIRDIRTIDLIVARAERCRVPVDRQTMVMDLIACHANGTPLDLDRLLKFDEFDFWHDLNGIARHLDRTTGELGGCFRPRCAESEPSHAD